MQCIKMQNANTLSDMNAVTLNMQSVEMLTKQSQQQHTVSLKYKPDKIEVVEFHE